LAWCWRDGRIKVGDAESTEHGCGSLGAAGGFIAYAKADRHPELPDHTICEVFKAERPKLVPYAGRLDGFHAAPASVSKPCLVRFDNNKWWLPARSAVPLKSRPYANRIVIRQDGRIVAEHPRRDTAVNSRFAARDRGSRRGPSLS